MHIRNFVFDCLHSQTTKGKYSTLLGQIQHTWGKYSTFWRKIQHTCIQYGKYCTLLAVDLIWIHTTRTKYKPYAKINRLDVLNCPEVGYAYARYSFEHRGRNQVGIWSYGSPSILGRGQSALNVQLQCRLSLLCLIVGQYLYKKQQDLLDLLFFHRETLGCIITVVSTVQKWAWYGCKFSHVLRAQLCVLPP